MTFKEILAYLDSAISSAVLVDYKSHQGPIASWRHDIDGQARFAEVSRIGNSNLRVVLRGLDDGITIQMFDLAAIDSAAKYMIAHLQPVV